jgi:hypothetical protein
LTIINHLYSTLKAAPLGLVQGNTQPEQVISLTKGSVWWDKLMQGFPDTV